MIELNKKNIDKVINEIRNEINDFNISQKSLTKFHNSKTDNIYLNYIKGDGGYVLKFIPMLIKKLEINNILELGNREGLSTLCIWDHLGATGKLTTVDIVKDLRYCPEEMYSDKRVRFVFGDVSNPEIYDGDYPSNIEFMYMDTIHYNYQASDEFNVNKNFLAEKALVAIDDININDKRVFFDNLNYTKWDLSDLCHSSGWGLFLFERQDELQKKDIIDNIYKESVKIFYRKFKELELEIYRIKSRSIKNFIKTFLKKVPFFYKLYTKLYNEFHKKNK